jgi:hypothetical protein
MGKQLAIDPFDSFSIKVFFIFITDEAARKTHKDIPNFLVNVEPG